MEILSIIAIVLLLGFTSWRIYIISKRGTIDSNAWAEIRVIGYQTIEDLVKLYNVKDDKDQFIDFILDEVANAVIDSENLTEADKAFWNKDNLSAIFKPIIVTLIDKIVNKTK